MKKYKSNEDYFENIDTEMKAYFLGLLYADGCITDSGNFLRMRLVLQEKDKHILDCFKNELESEHPISERKMNSKNPNWQNQYGLIISSFKLCSDLINKGCVPRKSLILTFPDFLEERFYRHFIRGYFDGDGCVSSVYSNGPNTNLQFVIKILGTQNFCEGLSNKIMEQTEIGYKKVSKCNDSKIYRYYFGGNRMVKIFYEYLYKDATVFLKRKREKMLGVFDIIPFVIPKPSIDSPLM